MQYFIPGFVSVYIFCVLTSQHCSIKIMCCAGFIVSYIYLSVFAIVSPYFINDVLVQSGIITLAGAVISLCFSKIYISRLFKKFMVKFFNKTPNNDIWRDVLDFKNGSNLKVYLKEQNYYVIGHYKAHEEKGNDSWIALSGFCKIDKYTNQNYGNEPSFIDDDSCIITLNFSNIEHIEIF